MGHHHSTDFLKAKRHFSRHERPAARRARAVLKIFLILFGSLVILAVPFAFAIASVAYDASSGRAYLQAAQRDAEVLDFGAAIKDSGKAHDAFLSARERLSILKPLTVVPTVGDSITALDSLLSSGISASAAVGELFEIGRKVVIAVTETQGIASSIGPLPEASTIFKDLSPEQKRRILAALADNGPRITVAAERIDDALVAFDKIPQSELTGSFAGLLAPLRAKLVLAHEALSAAAPLAGIAPALLGYPEEKHYLFFFQNDTELRPTGGFLGVFGAVSVKDASITKMQTDDIYALDGPSEKSARPAPPAPIAKYIGVSKWYLRDANWSPDFSVSSETMERFYREEAAVLDGGKATPPVDGIVAITTAFAEDVMRLVGPVTVSGTTFTANNLVEELQYQVEQAFVQQGIPFHERKGIVGELVSEVAVRFMAMPLSRLSEVLEVTEKNFKEGQIMLASKDPVLKREIDLRDWGGRLKQVTGDYLLYVDANLAALKTDQVIERSLRYSIAPSEGGFEGRATMTYHNKGSFTWKTTRYRTYARVYVPAGTQLIEAKGAMENDKIKDPGRHPGKVDVSDELGRRAFGAFVSVEPGETRTLEFRFRLAPAVVDSIKRGAYHLDVEKQLGTKANGLTLDLDFGKKLLDATPAEDRKEWGDTRYRNVTDLRIDRIFDLKF